MNLKALAYQLRRDTIDIICAGKAGHIGGDMSVMEVLVELYFDQMNIDAKNPEDPDRDLFVLSKGHSMEAYYAVLSEKGFLDKEDVLKNFSKFGSKYIGHPNNKQRVSGGFVTEIPELCQCWQSEALQQFRDFLI